MTASPAPTAEPPDTLTDARELLVGYLDYYRAALLRKLDGMSEEDLRGSRLPSDWSPLALLKHLAFVERRWFRWGFTAEQVDPIWGEADPDTDRWHVGADESAEEIRALFLDECARSREIVARADLQDAARSGGGFNPPDHHPALIWIRSTCCRSTPGTWASSTWCASSPTGSPASSARPQRGAEPQRMVRAMRMACSLVSSPSRR